MSTSVGGLGLVSRSFGAVVSGTPALLAQDLVSSAPGSAPGYPFNDLVATAPLATFALQLPVPFPAIRWVGSGVVPRAPPFPPM